MTGIQSFRAGVTLKARGCEQVIDTHPRKKLMGAWSVNHIIRSAWSQSQEHAPRRPSYLTKRWDDDRF